MLTLAKSTDRAKVPSDLGNAISANKSVRMFVLVFVLVFHRALNSLVMEANTRDRDKCTGLLQLVQVNL